MRKLAAALLAVPVLAVLYLSLVPRRSIAFRVGLALGAGSLLGIGALSLTAPRPTVATPVAPPISIPLASFREIGVGVELTAAVSVDFSEPMDRRAVEEALTVTPATGMALSWSTDGRALTVRPADGWAAETFYTVAVGTSATDRAGEALGSPVRSSFMTRPRAVGQVIIERTAGKRVTLDSGFVISFDRPVDLPSAMEAFTTEPAVKGSFEVPRRTSADRIVWRPAEPLAADTVYQISFGDGLRDADGSPLANSPVRRFRTEKAPAVVRFRPRDDWTAVTREQAVSVRFTIPMDRAATTKAFTVRVNGSPVTGKTRWAENDTVLVLEPAKAFPYGAKVVLAVGAEARSRTGAALSKPVKATFTVVPKPKPAPAPATTRTTPTATGGGSLGTATWRGVETYYLRLMNCSRQGGIVTSSGGCSSPGGSGLRALALDASISSRVARPYAKLLATRGACSHYIGSTIVTRFRRAGYTNWSRIGENLGCRSGNPYSAVLGSHLFFQSERSYGGGHWRNITNPIYDRVGIGVWVYAGRVRLAVAFLGN